MSIVGLGGNVFGGPRLDQSATSRVIDAALDLGVNFVDTANVYGGGESEVFLGKALARRRDRMVIASKFNFNGPESGTVAQRINEQVNASLSRLGTTWIDLYQWHFPEATVRAAEVIEALNGLVESGKVRSVGVCNHSSWRLAEAAHIARANEWHQYATVQNYYHLLARDTEREVAPFCEAYGTSILPYHPLGGGFLTGKYRLNEPAPPGTRGAAGSPIIATMRNEENYRRLSQLERFCTERSRSIAELAIAWLASKAVVASVIAGVSNVEQLTSNVHASRWALTKEELDEVELIVNGPHAVTSPETLPYK